LAKPVKNLHQDRFATTLVSNPIIKINQALLVTRIFWRFKFRVDFEDIKKAPDKDEGGTNEANLTTE
jgi:hypothetical protein